MIFLMGFLDFYYRWRLSKKQEEVNRLYEENGLTDDVFEKQLLINKERHERNISDETQLNDDGWSQ